MNIFKLSVTSVFQLFSKPAVLTSSRKKLCQFVIVSIVAPVKISMMPSAPPQVNTDLAVVHRPKISFSIDSIVSSKKDKNGETKSANDNDSSKMTPRSQFLHAIRGGSSPPSTVPFSIRHHLHHNRNAKIDNNCEASSTNGGDDRGSPEARNSSPVSRSPSPAASDGGETDNLKSALSSSQISPTSVVPRGPLGFLPGLLGQSPAGIPPPPHSGLPPQMGAFPHPPPHGVPGVLNFAAAAAAAAAGHHPPLPMWGQPPHHPSHHPVAHPLYPWLLARQARLFPHHRFGPGQDLPGFLFQPFRKPKRIRTAFSPTQLLRLEHAFEKNHYVVGTERKQLAKTLALSETQVKVWFQNRRTKHKRTEQEEHTEKKTVSVSGGSRSDLHPCGSSADSSTKNFNEDESDDEEIVMDDEDEYSHSDEEHEMLQKDVHHNNLSNHLHLHNPHLQHHHSDYHKT